MNDVKKIAMLLSVTTLLNAALAHTGPVDFSHGPLRVSRNNRYLVHEDETPFFWLADTAWQLMQIGYSMKPVKPMLDLETAYPGFRHGRPPTVATDDHARRGAYWSVFAGSCGHTYGHHSIWQMHDPRRRSINNPKEYWYEALDAPSAFQMGYLRQLMEARAFTTAAADQGLILTEQARPDNYIEALRGEDFILVYTPTGKNFTLKLGKMGGNELTATWFDPRNGQTTPIGNVENEGKKKFDPPGEENFGNDWVLILDAQ